MQKIIEIKDVTFQYDNQETGRPAALQHLDLTIDAGSFTVILGHNGSGKSTLAKLMNGMLKPDSGTVLVDGMDTSVEENEFEIRRRLGLVFQNPDNQIICTIVEEDVAFGPENLGVPPTEIRGRVDAALETVGMSAYKTAAPHHLSGGQKQRVALAGILAMEPDCIVLDEPTAMLDPVGRKEVLSAITRLNREKGITVILITHFMEEAAEADRVLVMNQGGLIADGTPSEIFSNSNLLQTAGLALPQTTELLHRLSQEGLGVSAGTVSPKAAAKAIYDVLSQEVAK